MKKIILFSLLLILSAASFSQQTKNVKPQLTKTDYLQKSKNQKTTAWVLLGGGTAIAVIGATIPRKEVPDLWTLGLTTTTVGGEALYVLGGLAALSSIPLFIASAKNKRKAMEVSTFIKIENTRVFQQASFVSRSYPALSLKINL